MPASIERSHIAPRDVRPLVMSAQDAADYADLARVGINLDPAMIRRMASYAMDDQQGGVSQGSIMTPVQYLQNWLPGFVRVITAARKIDELVGITTSGSWEDEEIVQGVMEPIGNAVVYGDYTNIPLSSYNVNFVRRTVVRSEKGIKVGMLEEARAARIKVSTSAEKRAAAALSLEISRNLIGFNGFNNGTGLTYGFLNDPGLPSYVTVANGASASPLWSSKTFLEITADIRSAAASLQNQSQDTVNPEDLEITLGLPTSAYQYLSVVAVYGNVSVRQWLRETYPKMRVVSAPQLNLANGGANVFYMYAESVDDGATDDSRTFIQVVPAKFMPLGVEKQAKAYVEDYTNATAGIMTKRPYAIVRRSGI
jgi:hypothetical protein